MAIDLGTGGPKVALVTVDGATIGWRQAAVASHFLPDGGAEQDPNEMWSAVVAATRELFGASSPLRGDGYTIDPARSDKA